MQLLLTDDPGLHASSAAERLQCSQLAAYLQGWGENDRGVSYTFGPDSVMEFLQKHDLDLVCRAHQVTHPARQQPESLTAAPMRLVVNCSLRHGKPPLLDARCAISSGMGGHLTY